MTPFLAALRRGYDRTRLAGLVRDPGTIHFYWDVSEADRRALWERVGFDWSAGTLVLRLSEPLDSAAPVCDTVAPDWWSGVYVSVVPGRLYDSSLVFRLHAGGTEEIVRGPRLTTRPTDEAPGGNEPSFFARRDGHWAQVPPEWPMPDAPFDGSGLDAPDAVHAMHGRSGRAPMTIPDRPVSTRR